MSSPNRYFSDRARLASLSRNRPASDPELQRLRLRIRATKLRLKIEAELAVRPPLPVELRRELADVLLAGDDQ